MPGPIPKPVAIRQRVNKASTRSTLPTEAESLGNVVPDLPVRTEPWHPMVIEWWESVWRSPMASQFLDADLRGGLYLLADLMQMRWTKEGLALIDVAKEIRHQEVRFGLSPIDRRRLEWAVSQDDTSPAKAPPQQARGKGGKRPRDPRRVLKVV